jgi:hypothetical protein
VAVVTLKHAGEEAEEEEGDERLIYWGEGVGGDRYIRLIIYTNVVEASQSSR